MHTAHLVSIIIILLILGCQNPAFEPNAVPVPTESWHVYTHPTYKFTFEYSESLDREPLIWNCGISERSETSISFGALSSVEIKEVGKLDLVDYAAQFVNEYPDYKFFSTTSSENSSGLASIIIEYSEGAPRVGSG